MSRVDRFVREPRGSASVRKGEAALRFMPGLNPGPASSRLAEPYPTGSLRKPIRPGAAYFRRSLPDLTQDGSVFLVPGKERVHL